MYMFRLILRAWRFKHFKLLKDFLVVFDSNFYRNSSSSIFALFFPRVHFVLFGQRNQCSPSPFWDVNEYTKSFPRTFLKEVFPFFHYLENSFGVNPINSWDSRYLALVPSSKTFGRSLLVHHMKYNRNQFVEEYSKLNTGDSILSNNNFEGKQLTFFVSKSVESKNEQLSFLNVTISNCNSTFIHDFNQERDLVSSTRRFQHLEHNHVAPESKLNQSLQVSESGSIELYVHDVIILCVDEVLCLGRDELDDDNFTFELHRYFNHIQNRQIPLRKSFNSIRASSKIECSGLINSFLTQSEGNLPLRIEENDSLEVKRIVLISHDDSSTGAPIYLNQIAKDLANSDFEVLLIYLVKSNNQGQPRDDNFQTVYLSNHNKTIFSRRTCIKNWRLTEYGEVVLEEIISNFSPDVLVANTLCSVEGIRVATKLGVPNAIYVHESWDVENFSPYSTNMFFNTIVNAMQSSNLVFFGSKSTQSHWSNVVKGMNSHVLPSYRKIEVPSKTEVLELRRNQRLAMGILDSDFVFISIASFERRKCLDDVIYAFQGLGDNKAKLVLVGKNRSVDSKYITDKVDGYENILIYESTSELDPFYAMADCFVFASREETFPLVLQEAAFWKLPRIVSKYPGVEELIPSDEFALLFPINDISTLTSHMQSIMKPSSSYSKMIAAAYDLQMHYASFNEDILVSELSRIRRFRSSLSPISWING